METCSHSGVVTEPTELPEDGALARSQAARRRRVLDATLALADEGGFDAVQMRDVAAEAGVALGTVYRYFSSKERLLLEANVGQVEALGAGLLDRPADGRDAGRPGRRRAAARACTRAREATRGDRGDGARARLGAAERGRRRAPGQPGDDRRSSPARCTRASRPSATAPWPGC